MAETSGRCERCGAWAVRRVEHNGWLLHPECTPAPETGETLGEFLGSPTGEWEQTAADQAAPETKEP